MMSLGDVPAPSSPPAQEFVHGQETTEEKRRSLGHSTQAAARADRESARAVRFLCKAILTPIQEPSFKTCKFTHEKKKYSTILTSDHCQAIQKVVKEKGNVPAEVGKLLGSGNASGRRIDRGPDDGAR